MIKIRTYKNSDYKKLMEFLEKLQDYLVEIDPMNLMRRTKNYGEIYTQGVLEKVKKFKGKIFLAEGKNAKSRNQIVGFIAGIVNKSTKTDEVEHIPIIRGRVIELFIEPDYRGQKTGTLLMKEMEKYFKKKKCSVSKVEVFKPNANANRFYEKCGYRERMIDMIKKI